MADPIIRIPSTEKSGADGQFRRIQRRGRSSATEEDEDRGISWGFFFLALLVIVVSLAVRTLSS